MTSHPQATSGTEGLEAVQDSDPALWEGYWADGLAVGDKWDAGMSSPVLVDLLESGRLAVDGKTVLVPGCGRGYDVLTFASAGASKAMGLEISDTAVKVAEAHRDSSAPTEVASRSEFLYRDFFNYEQPSGHFDVGYDYTFFCAIQPSLRKSWASQWWKLIKPGGQLVCLIFPNKPELESGPPFYVSPELCKELLTDAGFEEIQLEAVPEDVSVPGRGGFEYISRWDAATKRKPTEAAMAEGVDAVLDSRAEVWEGHWAEGLAVGEKWDRGKSSGALVRLLESGDLPVEGQTVFVPGCGRGYDVLTFASAGAARATGLEISETAVKAAEAHRDALATAEVAARSQFVCGDFFQFEPPGGKFDIGYDYT
eukprot:evm.model.scf_483.3 EVM.evm.TU.scf_483.3   scf_483:45045-56085(+)